MRRLFICFAAVLLPSVTAQDRVATPALPTQPESIPLTQIAVRGEELTRTLRDISRRLPAESDLAAFDEKLRAQEELVGNNFKETQNAIATGATLLEIRERLREWRTFSASETEQRKILSAWGTSCEQNLTLLNRDRLVWEVTLKNIREDLPEFRSVVPGVRSAIADIQTVKGAADQRLRTVLDFQARQSKQALVISDTVEQLNAARQRFQARLFYPDALPIWQTVPNIEPLGVLLSRSIARLYSDSIAFVRAEEGALLGAILFVVLIAVLSRRALRAMPNSGLPPEVVSQVSPILRRPLSLAALGAASFATSLSPLGRMSGVLLLISAFLFPILRLLPLYVSATRIVYFLAGFYALNTLAGALDVDAVNRRWILALVLAMAICILAWWGRPARFQRAAAASGQLAQEIVFVRWLLVVLVPLLFANVFGFLLLSYLLRFAFLLCSCLALVLYTLTRVTTTLFDATLRLPRIRTLASVRLHGPALLRWTERVIKVGAVICWVFIPLQLLELREPALQTLKAMLSARPGFRAFNFSLGDLLGFLGVLIFGYLLASGCRFVLREEILPRWRLSRGVPETISTSLYYVLLLLVFFMSLSAAGIELDKLTVLTGAFGVGIGFGMQNIVNNFVSGLILQFERPIRVGDVLEVGNLSGEIRHIGIRASTMRTFQGAEVIIPNSAFISGQVVNWTLTEAVRRVDIPVHVAYGTDPELVIKMLLDITDSHADVLREPQPSAVFQGFGDSSLDFLLMFWAHQDHHFRLRSDVSIHINVALREAGIDIPFPQREIRVRSDEAPMLRQSA